VPAAGPAVLTGRATAANIDRCHATEACLVRIDVSPTAAPPTDVDPTDVDADAAKERPLLRGWFHLASLIAVLSAGPFLVAAGQGASERICLAVYVASLVLLFGVSAAFHRIRWPAASRRRMRRADHSTIFLAIAGTNTAIAGLALTGWAQVFMLSMVWLGAAVGITLRQVWLDAPKWAVAVPYVIVGWAPLVVLPQLWRALGPVGFWLVLGGGVAYTTGAVVYALKRPDPWPRVFGYHEIFHLCTVIGASMHFVAIAGYALPAANH
jgi:hemolysin III